MNGIGEKLMPLPLVQIEYQMHHIMSFLRRLTVSKGLNMLRMDSSVRDITETGFKWCNDIGQELWITIRSDKT